VETLSNCNYSFFQLNLFLNFIFLKLTHFHPNLIVNTPLPTSKPLDFIFCYGKGFILRDLDKHHGFWTINSNYFTSDKGKFCRNWIVSFLSQRCALEIKKRA
jgi:hypothetical protein